MIRHSFYRLNLLGLVLAGAACVGPTRPFSPQPLDVTFLRDFAETRGFSSGQPTGTALTADGSAVIFLRSGPRDVIRNLYELNTATGEVRGLLRAEDVLAGAEEQLTVAEKARRERMRESGRGFTWFSLSEDGGRILVGLSGEMYVVDRTDGKVTALPNSQAGSAMDARFSPDGKYVSCIRGHDLYVIEVASGKETALTTGGTEDVSHGLAEFVASEEMKRHTGYWWSGDSSWLAYQVTDQRDVETLYIADARHPETAPVSFRYPRAGRTNAKVRLAVVPVTGGTPTWIEWDREKYPYMATVRWGEDSPLTVYVQTRDQRECVLLLADPKTGATTPLLTEKDEAWVNIDPSVPRWLAGGQEFLWTSERSGDWQLELRRRDGSLIRPIQTGHVKLYGLLSVDQDRREVVIQGGEDATQSHLYRLALDRGEIIALTEGRGSHSGRFSKDGNLWVETQSLADGTVQHVVRGRDAAIRHELPSVAEEPPFASNVELTTIDTGERSMKAAIVRPRNFVKGKNYPVIVYVYGGPGSNVVTAAARHYLRQQWIADQGFVVVSMDGRGTERRGRDWERVIRGNVIDAPLEDQAAGLLALRARYRELDLSRVGIYGWSFGGYFSAMAVLRRPDVFHCGVAGAPVIDWADYDTHYTERYMGLPGENVEGYRACSALTYAANLSRPLLLIHGTTDDNVYFTHTLKMAEALFRAGRPYDLLVLSGFTHMVPEPEVNIRLYSRIVDYFQKHLADKPPKVAS